jgi:hypothetical protein
VPIPSRGELMQRTGDWDGLEAPARGLLLKLSRTSAPVALGALGPDDFQALLLLQDRDYFHETRKWGLTWIALNPKGLAAVQHLAERHAGGKHDQRH